MCACILCVQDIADLPEGARTPALGLSNKAVFQGMNPLNLWPLENLHCADPESSEAIANLYCGI